MTDNILYEEGEKMDMLLLSYFQAVARENHLTRAAAKINLSQPVLSTYLSKFEKEVGVQLFDRVGRQIVLNEYGKMLLEHTDNILDTWQIALNEVKARQREHNSSLSLATTGIMLSQQIIFDFKKTNSDVNIKQTILLADQIVPSILKSRADFVLSSINPYVEGISSMPVKEEALYIIVNKNNPLSKKHSIAIAETKNQPFVNMPEGYVFRQFTDDICRKSGFEPNTVVECFPTQFSDMVYNDIGIAFVTERYLLDANFHPSLVALPINSPPCRRTIFVLWQENKVFSTAASKFYDFISKYK